MGIVQPQRNVLNAIFPPGRFREMTPHGVENYCCGGGSGFAIMQSGNFPDWRKLVSGRKKLEQYLNAFPGEMDPSIRKMICAPCSNCKGQTRDLLENYEVFEKTGIWYTGLVEFDGKRYGGSRKAVHRMAGRSRRRHVKRILRPHIGARPACPEFPLFVLSFPCAFKQVIWWRL